VKPRYVQTRAGHIKLHRRSLDAGLLARPLVNALWDYLMLSSAYEESEVDIRTRRFRGEYLLLPGQVIVSTPELARSLKQKEVQIRQGFRELKEAGRIETAPLFGGSHRLVTIVKWNQYQGSDEDIIEPIEEDIVDRKAGDEAKMEAFASWQVKLKDEADKKGMPEGMIRAYIQELVRCLELYYERTGGRVTPTRMQNIATYAQKFSAIVQLAGIEIYCDAHATVKPYKYLFGIWRGLDKNGNDALMKELAEHRRRDVDGLWSTV